MPAGRPSKIVLLLALAYHWERLVREGVVRDYADIARLTGLTRARLTQIINLLLLAPSLQEAILGPPTSLEDDGPVTEHALRSVVREPQWHRQARAWSRILL